MAEIRRELQQHSGVKLGDIFFSLFKRKRTIMVCAALGIIAAAVVYFLYPPSYESQAKLLVRYVIERSVVDPVEETGREARGMAARGRLSEAVEMLQGRIAECGLPR